MVYGEGIVRHAHFHAARVVQLVGVNLGPQAVAVPTFEYLRRMLRRKESAVAEHIDVLGKAFVRHGGNHLATYNIDISLIVTGKIARQCVRSQKCGHNIGRQVLTQTSNDTQHFQFVMEVEPVSTLDFDASGAVLNHTACTRQCLAVKFVLGGVVQQVGRIEYSAAATRNVFVGESAYFILEFLLARSGIYDMCVRIAERREDGAATDIRLGVVAAVTRHRGHGAEVGDKPFFDYEICIEHRAIFAHFRSL